ncbi:outer membrane protein [Mesorhizobium qingshengii]|uniref:Opacity protein n=1 Tax=Mesorhizobium qingshengii TaxID=1165689 RepID=A0A1G5Y786_9HYPH|nr:outer membrane protein [Mesorhizobium qingshengii]SDA78518.1 Opacity protein [Mesorhizobium qingshengii]
MKFTSRMALAALGLMPLTPALAADYDPPIYVDQAPDYVPVEVGSGWYLRGDVSYLVQKSFKNGDFTFPSAINNENFSESEDAYFASVGFGYHFNDYLRADLNLGYFPGNKVNFSYDDTATATPSIVASGNLKNYAIAGILNGYVDLGTYVGITPYLGAGIGIVRSTRKLSASYTDLNDSANSFAVQDNKSQYSLAYTLNAGLAYQVSKNVSVDLGYQYFSAPSAEYVTAESLTSFPVKKGISNHQVKLGLRYDLW